MIIRPKIDRFLDPNRQQVLPDKKGAKFKELMETYGEEELRKMTTKRYSTSGHLRHISHRFMLEDAECVVDMGSGCCLFEGHIENLVNLDIFPYPGVNLLNDMRNTQLKDNVADGIICIGSHVWMEHTNEVMDEIYRISKPECIMFCKTNSITLWEYIDRAKGEPYDKEKLRQWIEDKHEVAEGPYFNSKKDKNKIKERPELNSRGHNKRVDRSKDMVDWAWIL
tara:strand:- start:47 stop:718 length:672 start_codon:yes stop_codon:yes gene_type:complete